MTVTTTKPRVRETVVGDLMVFAGMVRGMPVAQVYRRGESDPVWSSDGTDLDEVERAAIGWAKDNPEAAVPRRGTAVEWFKPAWATRLHAFVDGSSASACGAFVRGRDAGFDLTNGTAEVKRSFGHCPKCVVAVGMRQGPGEAVPTPADVGDPAVRECETDA